MGHKKNKTGTKKTDNADSGNPDPSDFGFPFIADMELDFHAMGLLTEYDVEKELTEFIEEAHAAGANTLLVITGKGRMVQPLVGRLLEKNNLVNRFKSAGYFNGQRGAYEIWLHN